MLPSVPFHTLSVDEAVIVMGLDLDFYDDGLSARDVAHKRAAHGSNEITVAEGRSWVSILLSNFLNIISLILSIVGGVAIWLKDWGELGVVIFVILFNGILGFYQEYGAEKSAAALRQMTQGTAKLRRDDLVVVVDVADVVVGDIAILEQGTCIPADCRVVESHNLAVKEDILTGEPDAVLKHTNRITHGSHHAAPDNSSSHEPVTPNSSDIALGDRLNMVYRNTIVTSGAGVGLVVAVGKHTELGRITTSLGEAHHEDTMLQKSMSKLMYSLFACCGVIVIIVFAVNRWDTSGPTILYACSVGIAILPEALLAVMTVAMTVSMKRMADLKCIVRKLNALEVLASVTNICSDKTGTLTQNIMTVQYVLIGSKKLVKIEAIPRSSTAKMWVSGTGQKEAFSPEAEFTRDTAFAHLLRCAALNSSTQLVRDDETGLLKGAGNPSEIAIDSFCWQCNVNEEEFIDLGYVEKGVIPFDSATKMMIVGFIQRFRDDPTTTCDSHVLVKGAPEIIMDACTKLLLPDGTLTDFTPDVREVVDQVILDLSQKALRCVAFAEKVTNAVSLVDTSLTAIPVQTLTIDLVFLGVVGIHDPPRVESLDSVRLCQAAGIKVHMLTGDHLNTANVIAHRIGILGADATDANSTTGPKFDAMSPEAIDALPELPCVIGRCSPQSKVRMIDALHRRGAICVMTGDGFNDAQSIKVSDIGCAMGSGTDATKSVAELIITDDNFASIVRAIAEGRRIRSSIGKFVTHLLSGNVAQVIVLVIGLAIQINGLSQYVISPVQILWLNVFTGAPPATGLTMDLPDDDLMLRPPARGTILTPELIADTVISGVFLGLASLCSFLVVYYGVEKGPHPNARNCNDTGAVHCSEVWTARTTAFVVLYLGLQLHAYNVRHARRSIFKMKWTDNPWLWGSTLFNIAVLIPLIYIPVIAEKVFIHAEISWQWGVALGFLAVFIGCVEVYKLLKNKFFPLQLGEVELPPELSRHETIILKQQGGNHYPIPEYLLNMEPTSAGSVVAMRRELQSSYKEMQQNTASMSHSLRHKMQASSQQQPRN